MTNSSDQSERKLDRKEISALRKLYDFLPDDKIINRERLDDFLKELESQGLSETTRRHYKTYINHMVDFLGFDDLRTSKRRGVDLPAMEKEDAIASSGKGFVVTQKLINSFLTSERTRGWGRKFNYRDPERIAKLYRFLPSDKKLNTARINLFCDSLKKSGMAKNTIEDYRVLINHFLDYSGYSDMKRAKGNRADLVGKRFGELLVIRRSDKLEQNVDRSNCFYWECLCSCGKNIDVPTNQLTSGNVTSCGHLKSVKYLQNTLVFVDNTCLHNVLDDRISSANKSGRKGVGWDSIRMKWVAYIQYKKKRYSLGRYSKLSDAIKAREAAEVLVKDDAVSLLEQYIKGHDLRDLPDSVIKMAELNGISLSQEKKKDDKSERKE